jgi:hypothetical protein
MNIRLAPGLPAGSRFELSQREQAKEEMVNAVRLASISLMCMYGWIHSTQYSRGMPTNPQQHAAGVKDRHATENSDDHPDIDTGASLNAVHVHGAITGKGKLAQMPANTVIGCSPGRRTPQRELAGALNSCFADPTMCWEGLGFFTPHPR